MEHDVTISRDLLLQKKPLVLLVGPTAVGKSKVGVLLAKALGTEVLAADSRQVFCGMDIGTGKPNLEERESIPHLLIDLVQPDKQFNVGDYRRRALIEINRLHHEGRIPLVVGGTGLYIRALVRGLWDGPSADWNYRRQISEEAQLNGAGYLHQMLMRTDPELASQLHPNDHNKIIRALEVQRLSGCRLSNMHQEHMFGDAQFSSLLIGLTMERTALYRKIEERVDRFISQGLRQEIEELLAGGVSRDLGAMKGLGYQQMAAFLEGEYDFAEAVRRIKRDTRRFAKRQMTWFRKEPNMNWISVGEHESPEEVAGKVSELISTFLQALQTTTTPHSRVLAG